MLDKMKALVREKDLCVLATVSDDKPHCSLVAYTTNSEGTEIYMVTHKKTRKYRNLIANPWVSLLIDTRDENMGATHLKTRALTVSGMFEAIQDTARKDHIRVELLEKHPHMTEFVKDPDAEVFSIRIESFLLLEGLTNAHFEMLR
jgi:nitroimidazol reductase NimA-like FMN-containing flavoprotein (pyridoxamine 5'-phosphate oxidase superfamily)